MSTAALKPEPKFEEASHSAMEASGTDLAERDLLDTIPWLPCKLSLEIPVARFTIGHLLTLTKGSIVETACHHTSDVPLRVNQLLLGWTEFDVIGDRLAVRITDQA